MSVVAAGARAPLASSVWQVAEGGWVALVVPARAVSVLHATGRERRLADRRAGRIAECVALGAAALTPAEAGVSRAHSAGAGAAAVGPAGCLIGVDVMATSRVTPAHARAVATEAEIGLVSTFDAVNAAAIIWGLKEAVVKATGRRGLGAMPEWTIRDVGDGWAVLTWLGEPRCVPAGWMLAGAFACSWVMTAREDTTRMCPFRKSVEAGVLTC